MIQRILPFVYILLTISVLSCKVDKTEVVKPENFTQELFDNYYSLLQKAKASNDHFEIGVQLANLEASADNIFYFLDKGISDDDSHCDKIFTWEALRVVVPFYNNVTIVDSNKFKDLVTTCTLIHGEERLKQKFQQIKGSEEEEEIITNDMRQSLMDSLDIIFDLDQNPRAKLSGPNRKELESDVEFMALIEKQDSICLSRVLKILDDYDGFPDQKFTGSDRFSIILLVLQHNSDLKTRADYRSYIENEVEAGTLGQGSLEFYDRKTTAIELRQSQH